MSDAITIWNVLYYLTIRSVPGLPYLRKAPQGTFLLPLSALDLWQTALHLSSLKVIDFETGQATFCDPTCNNFQPPIPQP